MRMRGRANSRVSASALVGVRKNICLRQRVCIIQRQHFQIMSNDSEDKRCGILTTVHSHM